MPVLHIYTNITIAQKDELLSKASTMIAQALSKPESYVMIHISDAQIMSFAGTTAPLAYLELKSLGLNNNQTADLSATLCNFITANTGIDASRIYIEFTAPERSMFGWNKSTF